METPYKSKIDNYQKQWIHYTLTLKKKLDFSKTFHQKNNDIEKVTVEYKRSSRDHHH